MQLEVSLKAIREKMRGIEGERDDAREELADGKAAIERCTDVEAAYLSTFPFRYGRVPSLHATPM